MKRRNAIIGLTLLSGATVAGFAGVKWWNWQQQPDFESLNNQSALMKALVDVIIPETKDSPSASYANVDKTIVQLIQNCESKLIQNRFIEGVDDIAKYAMNHLSKPFEKCSLADQNEIMMIFAKKGSSYSGVFGKIQKRVIGQSFFNTLKQYTSIAYCTSGDAANTALRYSYIPGRYEACIPYQPGDKCWATS